MYTVEILNRDFGKVYEGLSKASKNMIFFYKNNIGAGRTKFKRAEI